MSVGCVAARVPTRRRARLRLRTAASTPARKGVATGLWPVRVEARRFYEDLTAHRAVATALGCALEQASKASPLRVIVSKDVEARVLMRNRRSLRANRRKIAAGDSRLYTI
jgi:hypothetical protein